jgi:outer membrane receptor protein involved in Fe transport
LTDRINIFAQAKYARVDSKSEGQPTFDFTILTPLDNPFLPESVRSAAIANGNDVVIVNRDNLDIGRRGEDNRRETYRGVIGLTAKLFDNVEFEASYVYGESDSTIRQTRTRFNDRFLAAVDAVRDPATGNIVCRSNIRPIAESDQPFYNFGAGFSFASFPQLSFTPGAGSGCVPFNLFSEQQAAGAIDFILTDAVDRSEITQHVASASISGNLGERIKLWGGEIGFAIGAEYREEKSRSNPDPVNATGLTFGNALFPEVGKFNVKEAFAELNVPIVSERPFFHDLSVGGAVRLSDYSTVGGTTAYQVRGVYAPVRDVRFRATYAQAVRAPNIGELFGPQNQTFEFITDPCAPDEVGDGTEFRAANCQALLTGLGLTPAQLASFTGDTSSSIAGTSGGNRDLREETAKTITAGIVLQPRFIPNLTMSADFYDVEIDDAVSTPTSEEVAELCVDQPTLDNVFCDAVTRNPGSNVTAPGVISGFRTVPQNVARFSTRGVDFAANYRLNTGPRFGTFNFRLVGNVLEELEFIPTPGADVVNSRNTVDAPKFQLNFDLTWIIDRFTVNYGFNYFSETFRFDRQTIEADPDIVAPEFLKFDSRHTHDLQASYRVNDRFSFYGGARNILDQKSDVGSFTYPVGSPYGRFLYIGARVNLPGIL